MSVCQDSFKRTGLGMGATLTIDKWQLAGVLRASM